MNEVNYNEMIVLPHLQRKYQELTNQVLILEINLMIEQDKVKKLSEQIQLLTAQLTAQNSSKDSSSKKKKTENVLDGETY